MMNKEVVKAMNKKESPKKATLRKWWSKNGYKIMRVILFPIWIGYNTKEKINAELNKREEWSEERANEILSYYIPRKAEWDAEEKTFFYQHNSFGWGMEYAKKHLKRKDRRFWKKYTGWWGGEIRNYIIKDFELEGFTKEVGDCEDGWIEVCFRLNEENEK